MMAPKVAVMLSGCGFLDGSEIHESVLTLLSLDNAGAQYQCCAPDMEQHDVVDHFTKQPVSEKRNVLRESARIARGKIKSLTEIQAKDFDALIIPGGFGAAKNLCTYASKGVEGKPQPEVERVLREFVAARKPVGAICIAPILMAMIFGKGKISLTIGNDEETARDLANFGAEHITCPVKELVVDKQNRIVSTPAYMLGQGPADVYAGIDKAVRAVIEMCGNS